MKRQEYIGPSADNFFWRTYSRNAVDLVEEREGGLFGYEMKWGKARTRPPGEWRTAYPEASWEVITRDNYLSFIR